MFIHGQDANKFIFTNDGTEIVHQQPQSFKMILGSGGLVEVNGEDHKRIRSALVRFLKPECLKLKQYVGKLMKKLRKIFRCIGMGNNMLRYVTLTQYQRLKSSIIFSSTANKNGRLLSRKSRPNSSYKIGLYGEWD